MSEKRRIQQPLLVVAGAMCLCSLVLGQGATSATSVWAGVYSKAQAERGKDLYAKNCSKCHGENLQGKSLSDSSAPPSLRGDRFVTNWADLTLDDLHTRIQTSMPPDTPGSLKDEEYLDIIAFLLEQNAYPAGNDQLPSSSDGLKAIVIKKDK